MTLHAQTLSYYDWDDIQQFLCNQMGIGIEQFRDYHEVVGGEYKDFWHVWISINYDQVRNDSYETCFFDMLIDALGEDGEVDEYGDWVAPLKPALEALQKEIGADEFTVRYSW